MDEERMDPVENTEDQEPKEVYKPRPAWQVWLARIGLVIMILGVLLYYYQIATGGR